MRVRTPAGDIPVRQFTFPDGQRHVELLEADCGGFREATVETALTCADDLFDLLLVKDVLDTRGFVTSLDVRYLLGARMDRPINSASPFTLRVVTRLIYGAGFRRVRVLDPHSEAGVLLLDAVAVLPWRIVDRVVARYQPSELVLVAPDKGAASRVEQLKEAAPSAHGLRVVQGLKVRDSATGRLSGFAVEDASVVRGKTCLILDDICDGGGTFSGLAEELLRAGAAAVDLFVTHGVFSKGLPLAHVRNVYCTDSYPGVESIVAPVPTAAVFEVRMWEVAAAPAPWVGVAAARQWKAALEGKAET